MKLHVSLVINTLLLLEGFKTNLREEMGYDCKWEYRSAKSVDRDFLLDDGGFYSVAKKSVIRFLVCFIMSMATFSVPWTLTTVPHCGFISQNLSKTIA